MVLREVQQECKVKVGIKELAHRQEECKLGSVKFLALTETKAKPTEVKVC